MNELVGDVAQWITKVIYFFNYPGLYILMVLSNVYLPIPSQLVLPLAGFLVGQPYPGPGNRRPPTSEKGEEGHRVRVLSVA